MCLVVEMLKYKDEKCLNTYRVVCYTVFPVEEWLFEVKRMYT